MYAFHIFSYQILGLSMIAITAVIFRGLVATYEVYGCFFFLAICFER